MVVTRSNKTKRLLRSNDDDTILGRTKRRKDNHPPDDTNAMFEIARNTHDEKIMQGIPMPVFVFPRKFGPCTKSGPYRDVIVTAQQRGVPKSVMKHLQLELYKNIFILKDPGVTPCGLVKKKRGNIHWVFSVKHGGSTHNVEWKYPITLNLPPQTPNGAPIDHSPYIDEMSTCSYPDLVSHWSAQPKKGRGSTKKNPPKKDAFVLKQGSFDWTQKTPPTTHMWGLHELSPCSPEYKRISSKVFFKINSIKLVQNPFLAYHFQHYLEGLEKIHKSAKVVEAWHGPNGNENSIYQEGFSFLRCSRYVYGWGMYFSKDLHTSVHYVSYQHFGNKQVGKILLCKLALGQEQEQCTSSDMVIYPHEESGTISDHRRKGDMYIMVRDFSCIPYAVVEFEC